MQGCRWCYGGIYCLSVGLSVSRFPIFRIVQQYMAVHGTKCVGDEIAIHAIPLHTIYD